MKDKKIIISRFAEDDLNEIADYYNSLNPLYVKRVMSEFEDNVFSLEKFPKSGRIVPELERQGIEKYRELIQEHYRIIYEISGDYVIIHTVIDGRRNLEDILINKLTRYYR